MKKNQSQFNYKRIITFIITAYAISWLMGLIFGSFILGLWISRKYKFE